MIQNRIDSFLQRRLRAGRYLAASAVILTGLGAGAAGYAQTTSQLRSEIALIPSRITAQVDNADLATMHGSISPLVRVAADQGAAPASLQMNHLSLFFKPSAAQQSALKQLLAEQRDPSSPEYHHWLTPAEFGARFGPSASDVATVETWLASQGFSNITLEPGRQSLKFSGSSSQFTSAFHASLNSYVLRGRSYYSVASNPQIPSALTSVIGGFTSLNNFPVRNYSHVLGQASYNSQTHRATPDWTYPQGDSSTFVLSPQDFGVEYDLPNSALNSSYSGTTYNGTGETIAIINDSNINVALVNRFRSLFNLPSNPPQVILAGNDPGINGINNPDGANGSATEAYLDVEWAGAVAPEAKIDLVIAADTPTQQGLLLAAEDAVYSDLAPVMSLSFGSCEPDLGSSSNQFISQLWQQAAAEGITVVVSAGDSGAAGCDNDNTSSYAVDGTAVNGFASTPYDVAVGGTDFYYSQWNSGSNSSIVQQIASYWGTTNSDTPAESLKQYVPEQAWNDSQYGDNLASYYKSLGTTTIVGGGGGPSNCATSTTSGDQITCTAGYAKPAWQSGTGVPADKVRDVPDVSLFAADGLNYSYYPICASDGDCESASSGSAVQITGVGGTSASAPAFAGIMALVDQATGSRQGQADTVLYPLATQFPAAFHDVTEGSNSEPCEYSPSLSNNCISVSDPISVTDSSTGQTIVEGQTGSGTTPSYDAGTGYDLATGLGSVDAAKLIADWSQIKFASTSVTLTPSETSFAHGTSITISGTVTGSSTPTGTVALMSNSTSPVHGAIAAFTLSKGSFSGQVNNLPGGTYQIWGQYSGDSADASSASSKTSITVTPEASTLLLQIANMNSSNSGSLAVSNGGSVPYGTQLILTATPIPSSCASKSNCKGVSFDAPTGTVNFTDAGSNLNTAVLDVLGAATYNAALSVGAHTIAANYAGDNSYSSSSAPSIGVTVTPDTPSISLVGPLSLSNSSAAGTYTQGQANTFSIQVENSANSTLETDTNSAISVPAAAPTGNVTVKVTGPNNYSLTSTVTLSSATDATTSNPTGVGSFTLPATAPAGSYSVSVNYPGDYNYNSTSESTTIALETAAAQGLTTGTLVSSTTATLTGGDGNGGTSANGELNVSVTVTGMSGKAAPTGTVYLLTNNAVVGEGSLTASSTGDSSTTAITLSSATSGLDQGTNVIQVQYAGDTNYAPSSNSLTVTNSLSDFSMLPSTSFVSVNTGNQAVVPISIQSVNAFAGTINFTCSAGTGVTCSLTPATYSLATNGTTVVKLTVTASSSTSSKAISPFVGWLGGGTALACGLLLVIPARRRSWRNMLGMLILICVLGFGVGCGSGSHSSSGSGSGSGGGSSSKTTNTYNSAYPNAVPVTVVATSGSITHTLVVVVNPVSGS